MANCVPATERARIALHPWESRANPCCWAWLAVDFLGVGSSRRVQREIGAPHLQVQHSCAGVRQLRNGEGSLVWVAREFAAVSLPRLFFFFHALRFFTRFEANGLPRGNADLFTGAGIAPDAGLARSDTEDAEAAEFNALAAAHRLLQGFENGFDGLLGLGAADVRRRDDGVDDVQLDHANLPRFRGRC